MTKKDDQNKQDTSEKEQVIPKPDYYMSGEYRGSNNQFSKGGNYTLEIWPGEEPNSIKVKDLKSDSTVTYASMKEFTTDWMHVTQLLNYLP